MPKYLILLCSLTSMLACATKHPAIANCMTPMGQISTEVTDYEINQGVLRLDMEGAVVYQSINNCIIILPKANNNGK